MKQKIIKSISLLFMIASLLPFSLVESSTSVSGNIFDDTVWSLGNSPYIVTDTVQVLEGVTLTIEPGVVIKFNNNAGLNIGGKLIALGTQENFITFTTNEDSWEGIKFFNTSTDAAYDENENYESGSIIKYSNIEKVGYLTQKIFAIDIDFTSPLIINNNIINNNVAIRARGTKIKIINNIIDNNIEGIRSHGESIFIKDNIITNNQTGIYLNFTNEYIINFNKIYNNDSGIIIEYGGYNNEQKINNNNIFNKDYNIIFKGYTNDEVSISENWWGTTEVELIKLKIYDYYNDISLPKAVYDPYALAELKHDGTDEFSDPPTCTSWTYSNWFRCQTDGTQSRAIKSFSPIGCSGGNPITTQSCEYNEINPSLKAEGVIRVYNTIIPARDQTLIKNTRFLSSPGELIYRSNEQFTIPANGYIDIGVTAEEIGEEYNITSATFSVPGLTGTSIFSSIYAETISPLGGGAFLESSTNPTPTQPPEAIQHPWPPIEEGEDYHILNLEPGWNIVSTPRVLSSHEFSIPSTANNFDIYVLDPSNPAKWSTMQGIEQNQFTPLYAYFINNKTEENQTLKLNYNLNLDPSQRIFQRTLEKGWNVIGIAVPEETLVWGRENKYSWHVNEVKNLANKSITVWIDLTANQENINSLKVSDEWSNSWKMNSNDLNVLSNFKGYAVFVEEKTNNYIGFQDIINFSL